MSVTLAKYFVPKWKLLCFTVLALAFCASNSWAQAPSIVFDAQQTVGYGYSLPQSLAISSNGTVFIADTANNRIVALDTFLPLPGVNNVVSTAPYVLSGPSALALDANGNLFVGDAPTTGGRIIELFGDGNGNLSATATPKLIVSGAPLVNPIALTFDSAGTLFIGDLGTLNLGAPPPNVGFIYSMAAGTTVLTPLTFTGLPAQFAPAALLRDASTNLYISDNGGFGTPPNTTLGGIYKAPDIGGTATPIPTQQFTVNQPSGMAFDAAGNLYVATLLGTQQIYNAGQQVLVIPALSPTTPYILPSTGLDSGASMAFDQHGNLDVLDSADGAVLQLSSPNPVNLGNVFVGGAPGPQVLFNFEFNAPVDLRGFQILSQGDVSTEISQVAGSNNCTLGTHNRIGAGGPRITAYYPYSCNEYYEGTPTYPGVRNGAIQVRGAGTTILASAPVWQTGYAGAEVTYPLTATTTVKNLQQPQAIVISGLNKTVYVADTQAGKVYSYPGLASTKQTTVNTGTIVLSAPSALALDGAGDLYIADYGTDTGLGQVVKVPTTTGAAPSVVNTGVLLQHPIALTFDYLGNMYIGDAGTGGVFAGASNPGFLVKVPVGGAAFQMPIPATLSIIFPQALATDPYTADLLIGDGGDPSSVGQVVKIFANGSSGQIVLNNSNSSGVTDPTGLAFDQAENLYVLDGNADTITAVAGPQLANEQYPVTFDNTTLSTASALAISAGGQSFVVASIGTGSSNNLVHLNGNASKLAFGTVNVGTPSPALTATVYNIGNLDLTLRTPYYVTNGFNAAFDVLNSSTCANGMMLAPSVPCTMNIQFTPQSLGGTNQQITVESDAYNGTTNNPVLTVQGTGGGAARHRHPRDDKDDRDRR
jgi:sugar lactone lactonase YvrE